MGFRINFKVPHHKLGIRLWLCCGPRPPQNRFDVCQHHVNIEWLGDIVIRAQFKTDDLIQLPAPSGEKNDREIVLRLQFPQGFQSIHARQTNVEHHKIGRGMKDLSERVLGIRRRMDLIASLLQMERQAAAHERVVIHKQYGARHSASVHLIGVKVKPASGEFCCKRSLGQAPTL